MPDINQVTLPSGTTYDLRDSRVDTLEGFTRYLGVTTTELTDGATTNPIVINNESVTASSGDIVLYGNSEFIFDGTHWNAFGDLSALGTLAYKNSIAVSTTATGTVSQPTFSGSETTSTGKFTPSGSISTGTGTANYTPAGSVSTPTISVKTAGSTASITPFGSAGTLPSCTLPTYTVNNGVLTITAGSFSAGTLPSGGTAVTVKTGDAAYQSTQPTFTGTGTELKFTGTEGDVSVKGTPSGTVSQPTFTGNAVSGTVTYSPS